LIWPDVVLDLHDLLAGVNTPVYIVGGALPDAYLHRPIHDIDLVTPKCHQVGRQITDFGRRFFVLGLTRCGAGAGRCRRSGGEKAGHRRGAFFAATTCWLI
jgi:hypothetical protein